MAFTKCVIDKPFARMGQTIFLDQPISSSYDTVEDLNVPSYINSSTGTNRKGYSVWKDGFDEFTDLDIDTNGRIVVVGGDKDLLLVKYLNNGTLDHSFGIDGVLKSNAGSDPFYNGTLFSVKLLNNKIFVSGVKDNYSVGYLAKHNFNGSLDITFGNSGLVYPIEGFGGRCYLVLQSDNKIILGSNSSSGSSCKISKYNVNGQLEITFGTSGSVSFADSAYITDIFIQLDDKILVLCSAVGSNNHLFRCNSDGSLDTSFSGDGVLDISTSAIQYINGITEQSDGKILVTGLLTNNILKRFNANGTVDTSFGTSGTVTTSNNSFGRIVLQNDNKIVLCGYSSNVVSVARCNTNGTMDSSFGDNGLVHIDINDYGYSYANDLKLQSDGKILIVGEASDDGFNTHNYGFIVRLNTNGTLDTSFGDLT